MSSRQEEKERRRQERLAREQAEARAASRRRRLQLVLGGLLAAAAIAVGVVLVSGAGGDDGDGREPAEPAANVAIPRQEIGDLDAAAEAARCRVTHPEIEGASHEERDFTPRDYQTNPPTSGNHFPTWYQDGIYEPGGVPELGRLVHTLEHGRINVQYKPGTPARVVDQLESLLAEQDGGYHMLLYENTTRMDAQVAATTWGHSITCPAMNDQVFDALRTFRAEYIDQGPEQVP